MAEQNRMMGNPSRLIEANSGQISSLTQALDTLKLSMPA